MKPAALDSDNRTSFVMIRKIAADADPRDNRVFARANQYPTGYGHDFPSNMPPGPS